MNMKIGMAAVVGALALGVQAEVPPPTEPFVKSGETLVCFGDSITAIGSSYIAPLGAALEKKGVKVVNCGLGGDKTPMALTRIGKVVAAKPDAVLIFFGANDAVVGRGRWRDEPTVDPVTYRDNLVWIVHYFRLHTNVRRFAIVAPPCGCEGDSSFEYGKHLEKYGLAAREAADRANAVLIPLDQAFAYERQRAGKVPSELYLTRDGIHFSALGTELAGKTILKYLNLDK